MSPALRLVHRRAPRPSVIVDMAHPHFTPQWTLAEIEHAQDHGPIHPHVLSGMYIAAWARAEHCPLNITAGRLEPHCRHNPSDELWAAVAHAMGPLVGSLGFAIPIRLDQRHRAFGAAAPYFFDGGN